jgi:hypothetical protein
VDASYPGEHDRRPPPARQGTCLWTGTSDAALLDEALAALLARHRSVEINAAYAAYDEHPLDEPDEWGDLASCCEAAAAS